VNIRRWPLSYFHQLDPSIREYALQNTMLLGHRRHNPGKWKLSQTRLASRSMIQ
jgi:hypothetical protein